MKSASADHAFVTVSKWSPTTSENGICATSARTIEMPTSCPR